MRAILGLLALGACGAPDPTWNADVGPILVGRCVSCHGAAGPAPIRLDDYAAAKTAAAMVREAVTTRRMPPWRAGPESLPLLHDPSLTDAQIDTIAAWVDAGAPEGDVVDDPVVVEPVGSALSRRDVEIRMPEAYVPTVSPDEYRCFVLDWDATAETYVTGFAVTPGDTRIVHHVAAFLFGPDSPMGEDIFTTLDDWDAADPGPGYSCFGGPAASGSDLQVPVQQLAQWVPGNAGTDFPAGTGLRVLPGSKIVLQLHYNLPAGNERADQTSIAFKLDAAVEKRAAFAPWLNAAWPMGTMAIPPGTSTIEANGDPRALYDLLLGDSVDASAGFDIHSALLHMHTLGSSASVSLVKPTETVTMLDIPAYDFGWQITYAFAAPVRFDDGDKLDLKCVYDNPGTETANWGEGTGDEMCVANLYISEP